MFSKDIKPTSTQREAKCSDSAAELVLTGSPHADAVHGWPAPASSELGAHTPTQRMDRSGPSVAKQHPQVRALPSAQLISYTHLSATQHMCRTQTVTW